MHQFDFGWGSAPNQQRSPNPLAGFKGPTSSKGRREKMGGKGEGRGGQGDLLQGLRAIDALAEKVCYQIVVLSHLS